MNIAAKIMKNYGERIVVGGVSGCGILSCLDADNAAISHRHIPSGIVNGSKFRLLTDLGGISVGASATVCGREFTVVRVEPVHIFGHFSHNECVLKLKGGASGNA